MFKKLLYAMFVTDKVKLEANQMTAAFLVLYFASFWVVSLSGQALVAVALYNFIRISLWMCITWVWADILFLSKCSWFRDRRKYPWPH